MFTPICTECHSGGAAPEGLVLEEGQSYSRLVNVPSVQDNTLDRVEPGQPDNSYLVRKIEGTGLNDRMPQGRPPLTNEQIQAIRQWITDGAVDDTATRRAEGALVMDTTWPAMPGGDIGARHALTVTTQHELDPTRISTASVFVVNLDTLEHVPVTVRMSSLTPSVIVVEPVAQAWAPGRYELRIAGQGPFALQSVGGAMPEEDHATTFNVAGE